MKAIKKKHPKTIQTIRKPQEKVTAPRNGFTIARWCPWGKWSADGTVLMNPAGKIIYPPTFDLDSK
jgi:hypothetical protein